MTTRILYRCHGATAQEHAETSAAVIKGYFDLHNKRVKLVVEKADLDIVLQYHPWDVKIITSDDEKEAVAHAVGWAYLEGMRDGTCKFKALYTQASNTFHNNERLANELRELKPVMSEV